MLAKLNYMLALGRYTIALIFLVQKYILVNILYRFSIIDLKLFELTDSLMTPIQVCCYKTKLLKNILPLKSILIN